MKLLEIGKIIQCHGVKGYVKAVSYLESDEILRSLKAIYIRRIDGRTELLKLNNIKIQKKNFLLSISGVEDLNTAKSLMGCQILIPFHKLRKLPEDEYYWWELIGLEVIREDGHVLGRIREIFPTGSNDVYVCDGGDREILLPAIAEVVRKIDTEKGIMTVRLFEGL